MRAYSPQKMHMHPRMRAYATVQKLLCHGNYCELSCLQPSMLLSRQNQSPDAVRSSNPSKSTIALDAVAAAVSHKHHSIIRVGAGLTQFVYVLHLKRGHRTHFIKNSIFAIFLRELKNIVWNRKQQ